MKSESSRIRGGVFSVLIVCTVVLLYGALALLNACTPMILCENGEADVGAGVKSMSLLGGEWLCYPGAPMIGELHSAQATRINSLRIGSMEGNTYRVMLRGEALCTLCFSLPRSRGSQLWIDNCAVAGGEPVSSQDVFAFEDYLNPSQAVHELVLRIPVSGYFYSGYQGIAIGARQELAAINSVRYFIEVLCLGLYMTLGLVCMTLYLQKTSETYILYLVFFTLLTAYRFMNYSEHFSSYAIFAAGSDFFRLFFFLRYVLCRVFVPPRHPGEKSTMDRAVLAMGLLGGAYYLFFCERFVWLSSNINLVSLLLEGLLIARGLLEGRQGLRILLTGWSVYTGMEVFYRLLHIGVIPQGIVDVLVRPTQYAHMAYLVAFAAAVLGKFACKFSEAEVLAVSLEQKVLKQTQELRQKSQHIIEEQNRRQQFITGIVHNLRNPLFALGGYMELLENHMHEQTAEQKAYIQLINDKLAYVNRMVDDMLFANRLENGSIRFHFVKLELGAFLRDVADSNKRLEQCESVQISCPTVYLEADGFRLHQAIDNLLDNAVIHGGCTQVDIAVRAEQDSVILFIRDNGRGMTKEQLEHAFDRYYTNGMRNSTGLGLPIAEAVIQQHHGKITLYSPEEKGVVCEIVLPVHPESVTPDEG